MVWTIRKRLCAVLGLLICHLANASGEWQHGLSFFGPLRYPPDFAHFDYVNPDAPKGGYVRVPELGTWDSFNGLIASGRPAEGINFWDQNNLLYDRLLAPASDEPTSRYGRLAEGVLVAPDYSSITFRLREGARWHDGVPITTADVEFTFRAMKEHGSPIIKTLLVPVDRIEVLDRRTFRYHIGDTGARNSVTALLLGLLQVFPKHYWETRDISRTVTEPPLGSGPYRIASYHIGRYVEYERVDDYWGRDLPVNRGRYNFDRIKFDYFRDDNVMREAHKAHSLDIRVETVAKMWAGAYDFPAVHEGLFKRRIVPLANPTGMVWGIFWNLRLPRFQDIRVREALWLMYDFAYINRVLMFGFYEQSESLFHGSPMAHGPTITPGELALLEPFRDSLPERVFTEQFRAHPSSGYGYRRDNLRRALELFAQAGWIIRDGVLVHRNTGERFTIEFLVVSPVLERALLPYTFLLRKAGIDATTRAPEVSNWLYRKRTREFEAGMQHIIAGHMPGPYLRVRLHSSEANVEGSINWTGIQHPAVDALLQHILEARDEPALLAATRALDRVILWHFYYIPWLTNPPVRMTWWDQYGFKTMDGLTRVGYLDAWWWDEDKAKRLEQRLAEPQDTRQAGTTPSSSHLGDSISSSPMSRGRFPLAE